MFDGPSIVIKVLYVNDIQIIVVFGLVPFLDFESPLSFLWLVQVHYIRPLDTKLAATLEATHSHFDSAFHSPVVPLATSPPARTPSKYSLVRIKDLLRLPVINSAAILETMQTLPAGPGALRPRRFATMSPLRASSPAEKVRNCGLCHYSRDIFIARQDLHCTSCQCDQASKKFLGSTHPSQHHISTRCTALNCSTAKCSALRM